MKHALPFCCLALLAACAGPRPVPPPAATVAPPEGWRGGAAAPAAIDPAWWKNFGDPALAAIVDKALAGNSDIQIAAARVMELRGRLHLARAQQGINVRGLAQGARERDVNPGFGIPEEQTAGEVEISIAYDADLFGRLSSSTAAARAALLSGQAAQDNVRLAVVAGAVSGYVGLLAADARLKVLHDTLEARTQSLRIIRRRADAGYASRLELAQAEADVETARQMIPGAELAIARAEDGLSLLLGESPRAILRGAALKDLALPAVPAMLPSALTRRRPDIASAEQQMVAADHALDAARAAFLPDVQLGASGGFVASTLIADPIAIFSLGGSILAPLFDNGRLEAQQETVAAQRDQAALSYRKTVLTAFKEVEDSLAAAAKLAAQEQSQSAQEAALQRAYVIATNRYREGYSPYLDQLDAERGLLSAQLALVQTRADRLNAAVSLYQALGGGWQPPAG